MFMSLCNVVRCHLDEELLPPGDVPEGEHAEHVPEPGVSAVAVLHAGGRRVVDQVAARGAVVGPRLGYPTSRRARRPPPGTGTCCPPPSAPAA